MARVDGGGQCAGLRESSSNRNINRHRRARIAGYCGVSPCRREFADEVEFVTIMWFESIDAVHEFAGDDYEGAVVPSKARAVLSRFDSRSAHYENGGPLPFTQARDRLATSAPCTTPSEIPTRSSSAGACARVALAARDEVRGISGRAWRGPALSEGIRSSFAYYWNN